MAIQFRRGLKSDFDETKLVSAEPAFCTDTGELFIGKPETPARGVRVLTTESQTLSSTEQENVQTALGLNNGVIDISSSFTFNSSVTFSNNHVYAIYNPATRTVHGSFNFNASEDINTSTNILSIASAYRPKNAFSPSGMVYAFNQSSWFAYYYTFRTDGGVRCPLGSYTRQGYCVFEYQI